MNESGTSRGRNIYFNTPNDVVKKLYCSITEYLERL